MTDLWPWLAIAGLGALHGLNPAAGWMFAAACGVHARSGTEVRRALLPIAIGHATSIAVVAWIVTQGMSVDRRLFQNLGGALLVGIASIRLLHSAKSSARRKTAVSHAGIALWSFLMTTGHGAGLMLVPALAPLCFVDGSARTLTTTSSLVPALAAVGVHLVATLVVTGVVAASVCRGLAMHPLLPGSATVHRAWNATLAVAGVLLMSLR